MTELVTTTPNLSEADFQQRIIDLAQFRGWHVYHARPARTKTGWRTPGQGNSGLPDLILARSGVVLLAELKSQKGKPTREQQGWLAAAGPSGYLWRPSDWTTVVEILR